MSFGRRFAPPWETTASSAKLDGARTVYTFLNSQSEVPSEPPPVASSGRFVASGLHKLRQCIFSRFYSNWINHHGIGQHRAAQFFDCWDRHRGGHVRHLPPKRNLINDGILRQSNRVISFEPNRARKFQSGTTLRHDHHCRNHHLIPPSCGTIFHPL